MRRFFRENGLTLVMFGLFLAFVAGQSIAALFEHNRDQIYHGQPSVGYVQYIASGDFIESVFENWESELSLAAVWGIMMAGGISRDKGQKQEEGRCY